MNPKKKNEISVKKDFEKTYLPIYPYVDVTQMGNDLLDWIQPAKKEEKNEEPKIKVQHRKSYPQEWTAYNNAQQNEKVLLMNILDELLSYIPLPERKGAGRKPISIRDKVFHIVLQAYNGKSSRRSVADLQIAKKLNYLEKSPHFNTILKSLKDPNVSPYLHHLISVSGLPLQNVESDFAIDSSGFSTSQFDRWLDVRTEGKSKKRRFRKCHLTCGVRTNIITAVNITKGYSADSPQFPSLVYKTNKIYDIREISADKAYSSKKNLSIVSQVGGIAYIPFKRHATGKRSAGSLIWGRMYRYFINNQEEFMQHYHKRSNIETVFHMIKTKFGKHIRSRDEIGQINEILAKCLAHNICVLVQESFELGIDINFEKCANIPIAHNY